MEIVGSVEQKDSMELAMMGTDEQPNGRLAVPRTGNGIKQ